MLLAIMPFDVVHDHDCHEQTVSHTSEDEQDPCHVSIYHSERGDNNLCPHQEHLSTSTEECSLCKVVVPVFKNDAISSSQAFVSKPLIGVPVIPCVDELPGAYRSYFQGRAPPVSA
jgi:hypothetical protein